MLTVVYHDESVENDFLRVLGQREVIEVRFIVLDLARLGCRLRHFITVVIDVATTSLLTARTQLQYPQPL